jgi:DNA-binding transcriptional regulator YdaS (Cro superfamily)
MRKMENGLKMAIKAAGGTRRLAALLGISPAAIAQWNRIPAERIIQIERTTGVPRNLLRPDLYRESPHWPVKKDQA